MNVIHQFVQWLSQFRGPALLARVFEAADEAWEAAEDGVLERGRLELLGRALRAWALRMHRKRALRLVAMTTRLARAWR